MLRIIASVLVGTGSCLSLAFAQGVELLAGPAGGSGLIIDHGGGLKTFQDHTGRQGTIKDLGNGSSMYRDSHGGTGIWKDSVPGMRPEQQQWGSPEFPDRTENKIRESWQNQTLSFGR